MKRFAVFLCGVALCLTLTLVMWHAYDAAEEGVTTLAPTTTTESSTTATTDSEAPPPIEEPPPDDTPTLVMQWVDFAPFAAQNGNLILVDSGYVGTQTAWTALEAAYSDHPYQMQTEAYRALCAMLDAYRGDRVRIQYAAAQSGTDCPPVCRGGVYASGLDVCLSGVDAQGQALPFYRLSDGKEWLYRHCIDYGFVACGEGVWGEEAGHFRYVGAPHAQNMAERGESLATYLANLRCTYFDYENALSFADGQAVYRIFYVLQDAVGKSGALLPQDAAYEISGDNRGGVIVTVREETA